MNGDGKAVLPHVFEVALVEQPILPHLVTMGLRLFEVFWTYLFGGVLGHPEPETTRQSQSQIPNSPTASQLPYPTNTQTCPHSAKHEGGEVNLSDILNFFHGIAAPQQGEN